MLMSHLGRPIEGEFDEQYSLAAVAHRLSELLGQPVKLQKDWSCDECAPGDVVLFENVRFNVGEAANDLQLAQQMAALCDVFVMDAFATAHRSQASTVGVAQYAPVACAGPLLDEELKAIVSVMSNPNKPVVAIVGGSKVSTKIQLLQSLLVQVDGLIVGGGIANTLLAAQLSPVGASLYEPDYMALAHDLMNQAAQSHVALPLPQDVQVAQEFSEQASATLKDVAEVAEQDMILDIGPATIANYKKLIESAGTIIWNGPVGVFEFAKFAAGTQQLGEAIADSNAYSIAGGGDTLAALSQFNLMDKMSYVSTGGGAFLALLQGEVLPAVKILQQREHDDSIT